jgi:hypothetical protein
MSTTTTYGYTLPANGERGTWWDQLKANWQRMNDHNHEGVNSTKITPKAITKATQQIAAASWVATSGGLYTQTVTLPTGYLFSTGLSVKFYVYTGGNITDEVAMTPVRASDSTYTLEINDNTVTLTAVYA